MVLLISCLKLNTPPPPSPPPPKKKVYHVQSIYELSLKKNVILCTTYPSILYFKCWHSSYQGEQRWGRADVLLCRKKWVAIAWARDKSTVEASTIRISARCCPYNKIDIHKYMQHAPYLHYPSNLSAYLWVGLDYIIVAWLAHPQSYFFLKKKKIEMLFSRTIF